MPRLSAARTLMTALVLAVSIAACGVPLQDRPVELEITTATTQSPPPSQGPLQVTIYFVNDERLQGVTRSTDETSLAAALALLLEGPSASEADAGLTTSLLSQPLTVHRVEDARSGIGTVTIGATEVFTTISADDQRLATAQLVWTLTDKQPLDRVRVTLDGATLRLPTDDGAGDYAVTRTDYLTLAPPAPDQTAFTAPLTTQ